VIVLIPAYEPDERMVELVDALDAAHHRMLVVDDGSGPTFAPLFRRVEDRGVEVLYGPENAGKASALRRGLAHIAGHWPGEDVVTADSDGQHRPDDIGVVAVTLAQSDGLVLGGRRFSGDVPLRSRFGNAVSRALFRAVGGVRVHDTQTGLRGIPAARIPEVLAVAGERFAWEMNVLIDFARRRVPIREVEIATVYLDGNSSSHFRPIRDSLAVLRPLLRYVLVSFGSFVLDVVALQLLYAASGMLLPSMIGARLLSAAVNFVLNRAVVFRAAERGALGRQLVRYAGLALVLLGIGYLGVALLVGAGVPVLMAKILVDAGVYVAGFTAQRGFVFARGRRGRKGQRKAPADLGDPPGPSVRGGGLEPPRPYGHYDLNVARLPFRHPRRFWMIVADREMTLPPSGVGLESNATPGRGTRLR
jgi:putative flippase GtrA